MIQFGQTAAQKSAFHSLLVHNHDVKIVVQVLTLSGVYLSNVSKQLVDGQVNLDYEADISRSCTLTLFDPTHSIQLDANSPSDGAMFLDRMIRIYYVVTDPTGAQENTIPLFCGPITKLDRSYANINIECSSKEVLALDPLWTPRTYKRGANKVSVIKAILQATGENKFTFPTGTTARLATDLPLSTEIKPWQVCQSLARKMGYTIYYDGRGTCIMRKPITSPVWTFSDGAFGSLLSKPEVGYDLSTFVNAVIVKGVVPKGKTTPIIAKAIAPRSHPLSPWNLGRNGVPRYLWTEIDDDGVTSQSEANDLAASTLKRGLLEAVTLSFDTLPIPHLELSDHYLLKTEEFSMEGWIRQMTIPLVVTQAASIGYLKNVTSPNSSSIRRRK